MGCSVTGGTPRILIIRLSAIGDVVRALHALHALREVYPDAEIDWAVEPKAADIVRDHPALDNFLLFERPPGLWNSIQAFMSLCRRVRRKRYDIVVDLHGIFKSGFLTRASRAQRRFGFARPRSQEGSHLFYSRRVELPQQPINRVEENLRLCEAVNPRCSDQAVTIAIPQETQEHIDHYFDETFGGGKLVVAVHVAVDRPEKQWPTPYFGSLIDMLLADGRFDVILTWGPGQFPMVEQTLAVAKRKPVIAPETPDLKHYAWLVHRADLYFGGDTGPMHIAAAMGTAVVAVFGGTDPARHAPFGAAHEVLCVGTSGHGANLSLARSQELLAQITPEMAYDACVRIAAQRRGNQSSYRD